MTLRVSRQPVSLVLAATLAFSGALSIAACQVKEAAPVSPPAVTSAVDGAVKLVLKMPRELLYDGGNTYTRADIDHVHLELFQVDNAGAETLVSQVEIKEFELAEDVVFEHLNGNRHYRVKARAYAAPGNDANNLISADDERSWTEVNTTREQNITIASIKVKLRSVAPMVAQLVAGDGVGADLAGVGDMAVDSGGNLYFTETSQHVVWRVPANGSPRSVYAGQFGQFGNAPGSDRLSAELNFPRAVAVDADGNVFVVDTQDTRNYVRMIRPSGPVETLPIETPTSTNGFDNVRDIALMSDRSLLVSDSYSDRIYKFPYNGSTYDEAVVFAGSGIEGADDGATAAASFDTPNRLAVGMDGTVFVSDTPFSGQEMGDDAIRSIRDGQVTTLSQDDNYLGEIKGLALAPYGHLFLLNDSDGVDLRRRARNGRKDIYDVRRRADGTRVSMFMATNVVSGPNRTLFVSSNTSTKGFIIWKIQ